LKENIAAGASFVCGVGSFPLSQINAVLGCASAALGLVIACVTLYRMLRKR
jgi:hypothetical protein